MHLFNRRFIRSLSLSLSLSFSLPTLSLHSLSRTSSSGGAYHWDYKKGGVDWTDTCATGHRQSPINIVPENALLKPSSADNGEAAPAKLAFHYKVVNNLSFRHNGHAIKVAPAAVGDLGYITVGDKPDKYNLKQFHFHSVSEHTLSGLHFPLELHMVHQRVGAKGLNDLLVIGVLFRAPPDGSSPNPFLTSLDWTSLPAEPQHANKLSNPVDLSLLNGALTGEYFNYEGSLTTPPCSETVNWFVMKTVLGMSSQQVDLVQAIFQKRTDFAGGNGNNRVVQPLYNRNVMIWARPQASTDAEKAIADLGEEDRDDGDDEGGGGTGDDDVLKA